MTFFLWFFGICVHVFCANKVPVKRQDANELFGMRNDFVRLRMLDNNADYNIIPEKVVWKRATTAAQIGLAAVEKLLMGLRTASGPPPKNYRLYRKHGNAETALEDFQSVVPRIVNAKPKNEKPQYTFGKARRTGGGIVGTVGDRRLILLPQGDRASKFYPILEIRTPTDAKHDRIVYKMDY